MFGNLAKRIALIAITSLALNLSFYAPARAEGITHSVTAGNCNVEEICINNGTYTYDESINFYLGERHITWAAYLSEAPEVEDENLLKLKWMVTSSVDEELPLGTVIKQTSDGASVTGFGFFADFSNGPPLGLELEYYPDDEGAVALTTNGSYTFTAWYDQNDNNVIDSVEFQSDAVLTLTGFVDLGKATTHSFTVEKSSSNSVNSNLGETSKMVISGYPSTERVISFFQQTKELCNLQLLQA